MVVILYYQFIVGNKVSGSDNSLYDEPMEVDTVKAETDIVAGKNIVCTYFNLSMNNFLNEGRSSVFAFTFRFVVLGH